MQADPQTQSIDREALVSLVVRRLKAHENPDDIIFEICNTTAWDWQDAHRFLEDVANERRGELSSWEARLYLLMGVALTLVGFSLIGMAFMYIFGYDTLLDDVRDLNRLVGFTNLHTLIAGAVTGLGMAAGGIIGIIKGLKMMTAG